MPTKQKKQIVREFIEEILNQQRLEHVNELLGPDYQLFFPGMPEPINRHAFPQFIAAFPAAFPDFHIAVESLIGDHDNLAARFVLSGTQNGHFMGLPPTGRKVEVPGNVFYRVVEGKIVDDRPIFDRALMFEQLGIWRAPMGR